MKKIILLSISVASLLYAADDAKTASKSVKDIKLNDVYVKGSKRAHRKDNEITGLGKIVKTSDTIDKEMVLDIRDLTRYDPGISVVEQGQGASTGYAIRGLDKNRVGLSVDGVPQVQTYMTQGNDVFSGAINEIEYENIQAIEISKGASSSEFGSGSLGGSVQMRTKEAGDIIKPDKMWGLDTKTAYSSKNKRVTNSVGFGVAYKGFDFLGVLTHRKGKEFSIHKDALNQNITVKHVDYCKGKWFSLDGGEPHRELTFRKIGANDEKVEGKTEVLKAKDYTGPDRFAPNEMDYKSNSKLFKLGYQITPKHHVGILKEVTKQQYDSRDMLTRSFYGHGSIGKKKNSSGYYATDPKDGLAVDMENIFHFPTIIADIDDRTPVNPNEPEFLHNGKRHYLYLPKNVLKDGKRVHRFKTDANGVPISRAGQLQEIQYNSAFKVGTKYTKIKLVDERHKKDRNGFAYTYSDGNFFDNIRFSYDNQDITLTTREKTLYCSIYPNADKDCKPSMDKPNSAFTTQTGEYKEKHDVFNLELNKKFKVKKVKNDFTVKAGYDNFKSSIRRYDWHSGLASVLYESVDYNSNQGTKNNPIKVIKNQAVSGMFTQNFCTNSDWIIGQDCIPNKITGHNKYISINDKIKANKYLQLGFGARYDYTVFKAHQDWVSEGVYKNFSWNIGAVLKPIDHTMFSYRISTGFRNPSFRELFGQRINGIDERYARKKAYKRRDLKAEKGLNQEVAMSLYGDFGIMEFSYFYNKYKDLISTARVKGADLLSADGIEHFRNLQDIDLDGFAVTAKIDYNGIYEKIPEGFYSTFAYNKTRAQKVYTKPGYADYTTPLLDAIQPEKYVLGFGYEAPSENWGVSTLFTHSAAKKESELKNNTKRVTREDKGFVTKYRSSSWNTWDVNGFYKYKNFTLRLGVYNIFNKRYSTWESVRASATTSPHQTKGHQNRFVAPGRNFTASFEMKF